MVDTLHVPVLADVRKIRIRHAQLLALVNVGCSPETVNHRGQHLRRLFPISALVAKAGHHSRLIMVAPEHRIPGVMLCHAFLPGKQDILQFLEIHRHQYPLLISHEIHFQMVEIEHHGQFLSVLVRIVEAVFHGGGRHLPHRYDPGVRAESSRVQLPQILVDVGAICVEPPSVSLKIVLELALADEVDHVEPKSFDSLCHPEADELLHFPAHLRIIPVQIRLGYIEEMQIVFVKFFHILPGAPSELALPVGRRDTRRLAFPENVEILVLLIPRQSLLKPLMTVGGVIEHHIQHDADAALCGLRHHLLKVFHSPVAGINPIVIFHIVSVVPLGRHEEGRQPDIIHTQLLNVIQLPDYAPQISKSVPIAVAKGLGINLIHHALSEICHMLLLSVTQKLQSPSGRQKLPCRYDNQYVRLIRGQSQCRPWWPDAPRPQSSPC